MAHRPRIPDDIHERVEKYLIGEPQTPNKVYIRSVCMMIDEDGNEGEWVGLVQEYSDKHDVTPEEVLTLICEEVFEEDGEASIQFKQKLGLE